MSDKEKMKKAFQNLKAPEDTPERILEKMNQKENKRKPTVSRKCLTLAVTVALILLLGCGSVYAVKKFSLGNFFMQETPADAAAFKISFPFGAKNANIEEVPAHDGIDYIAEEGTPVLAAADGKVRTAEFSASRGNYIIIDHTDGFSTVYACLKEMQVSVGDEMKAGTQIGTVGSTGMSTGPHLHLELWLGDEPIDPGEYLR